MPLNDEDQEAVDLDRERAEAEEDAPNNPLINWPHMVAAVDDAEPWTTYKMADGSLIWGEYEWVSDTNFFDDSDEELQVVRERWVCIERETITLNHVNRCPNCGVDLAETGVKVEDDSPPVFCSSECYDEDIATKLADEARDEAKQP